VTPRLATAADPTSPFLRGNYAPVREEVTAGDLPVVGKIPAELDGMFVRNGPNPQFDPIGRYHWFDGDGMLHGVRLRDGKASYRNRFIQTRGWKEEREAGKALYTGMLEPPDLKKILTGGSPFKNAANTALVYHAKKLLALWEGGNPHEIRVPDLATVGEETFGGKLRHAFTAHPKVDPKSGEMFAFGYDVQKPYLRYSVFDAGGALVRTVPIDLPRPTMMHDFAVTEHHAVFFDLPAIFDVPAMLAGEPGITWQPEHGARIGVLPRAATSGESVRWFELPPFYVFHFLNAWESADGKTISVVGCRNERMPVSFGDDEVGPVQPRLHRWTIDLAGGDVAEEQLDDRPCDFPRVAPARETRHGRYGYVASIGHEKGLDGGFDAIAKYDLEAGTSELHTLDAGMQCGETVFAPNPDGTAEDDGWLLNLVVDKATRDTALWVLDAQDVTAEPLAKVKMPRRVPPGFHGSWMPGLSS